MIYIEEKSLSRQIELLILLSENDDYELCAWLYPESPAKELANFTVTNNENGLVPITSYENGFKPKRTVLVKATKNNLNAFLINEASLKKNCDSLALYTSGDLTWKISTIGHEGMCLVQDKSLYSKISKSGFNASLKAPEWW